MKKPKIYDLRNRERMLDFPFPLIRVGWMPHHIYYHNDTLIADCFICLSSNVESSSESIVNGVKQISPERVTPHFGVIRPGTRFHTITAAYHDELFFSYPAECYEKLVKLLQGNTSFGFSAYPEEPMADLKRELENLDEPGAADRADVAAIRLFTEIITKYREEGEPEKKRQGLDIHDLAADLLDGNDLQSLIADYGYSERTFYREWNKAFSESPKEYVIKHKISQACDLLAGTSLTPCEIATMCNFKRTGYFHQVFKQRTGKTPGEFRTEYKKRSLAELGEKKRKK